MLEQLRTRKPKRKRADWDQAFPGLKNLVPVELFPERIDVLNYNAGTQPNPETWRPPVITFGGAGESPGRP